MRFSEPWLPQSTYDHDASAQLSVKPAHIELKKQRRRCVLYVQVCFCVVLYLVPDGAIGCGLTHCFAGYSTDFSVSGGSAGRRGFHEGVTGQSRSVPNHLDTFPQARLSVS